MKGGEDLAAADLLASRLRVGGQRGWAGSMLAPLLLTRGPRAGAMLALVLWVRVPGGICGSIVTCVCLDVQSWPFPVPFMSAGAAGPFADAGR